MKIKINGVTANDEYYKILYENVEEFEITPDYVDDTRYGEVVKGYDVHIISESKTINEHLSVHAEFFYNEKNNTLLIQCNDY